MSLLATHRSGPADSGVPPLVLLHGFPFDARMWAPTAEGLDGVPVVAIDAPGFGASPSADDVADRLGRDASPSLELVADAVAATLDDLGEPRAVVAGLSMGGYVAMALAERHRSRIVGLGLLDTKAAADAPAARENRLRVAAAAEGSEGARAVAPMIDVLVGDTTREELPDVVATLRAGLAEAPPAGIAWAQRAMAARPDRRHALVDLDVPGLVVRGAEDALASQEDAESMARALSEGGAGEAELVVVPRAGHMVAVEAPTATAAALGAFWRRCLA